MTNLERYDNNGLELVIDTNSGETFASISAVARMTDKPKQTISQYVNGGLQTVNQMTLKTAEIYTTTGLKTVNLLNESQMLEVISKYKPDLLVKFAQLGLRAFLHQLAGFEVKSTAVEPQPLPQPLPKRTHTVVEYVEASEKIEKVNNLTLRELLRDQLVDELSVLQGKNKALPEAKTEYTIGKVRATELGYSITEIGNGSSLGKWLAKSVPVAFEERVGRYSVKHYEVNPQLDTAIHTFFSLKKTMAK